MAPRRRASPFNVRDFGARGNRKANDRGAIQAAVDACAAGGGGTVVLPPGDYLSGTIRLAGGVTLQLDAGATLRAIAGREHYEGTGASGHLLLADGADRIAVVGKGRLYGLGKTDYGPGSGEWKKLDFRTGILLFTNCRGVTIRDVSILYSDAWTLHLKQCDDVAIEGVTIRNNPRRLNSDGIDPNMCRRVRIRNCRITAGDDCIVMKATERRPCEDIEVRDCVLVSTTAGIKFGTESFGDFRDIRVSDCTVVNAPVGVGFYLKDGGTMERIRISNVSIRSIAPGNHGATPFFMDIEKRYPDSRVGRIRDVMIENINVRSGTGAVFQGMPRRPIERLTLRDIRLRVDKSDRYDRRQKPKGARRVTPDARDTCYMRLPSYLTVAHVKGLVIDGVSVRISAKAFREHPRSAVCLRAVQGASLRGLSRRPGEKAGGPPILDVKNCRNVRVGPLA